MTKWYAVYTRPRYEKKVAEGFSKRKWDSYCPMNKTARSWSGLKMAATALFPCYVFVRLTQVQLAEVKKIDGVINLVYWLKQPAIIRDIEIEMLKRFLNVHKQVELEKTAVAPMAMVRLNEAPSMPQEGDRLATAGITEVRLLLPSLGYVLASASHQSYTQPAFNTTLLHQQEQQLLQ